MAEALEPIECSAQPLGMAFHPRRDLVAAGLVDGTLEVHDLTPSIRRKGKVPPAAAAAARAAIDSDDDESDEEDDSILSSIPVHASGSTVSAASAADGGGSAAVAAATGGRKATQGPSCRAVLFSHDDDDGGARIFAAGNGGGLCCLDAERACTWSSSPSSSSSSRHPAELWRVDRAHSRGINRMHLLPPGSTNCGGASVLVTGDDEGAVRLWDARLCGGGSGSANAFDNLMGPPKGCVMEWTCNSDYISGFAHGTTDSNTLVASSADGTLSVFDVRKAGTKVRAKPPPPAAAAPIGRKIEDKIASAKATWESAGYRRSDEQEDELLSVVVMKNGKKVVCGTQEGVLAVWSWGTWGDVSDRFPGHPQSIDALLKVDEDTILTGSSDGLIRAVQIHPDKLLGVLGEHGGFPVEALQFSAGRRFIGSMSHDVLIRLWDASVLNGEDDGESDSEAKEDSDNAMDAVDAMRKSGSGLVVASKSRGAADSDDEWEDMDEDEDEDMQDSDGDDSDDDSNEGEGKKGRVFKTENEKFFEDL